MITEERRVCANCNQEKPAFAFYKPKKIKDNHPEWCRHCSIQRKKAGDKTIVLQEDLELKKREAEMQAIIQCHLENPTLSAKDVAKKLHLPYSRVLGYSHDNRYLRSFRIMAQQRVPMMIPLALDGLKKSILSQDENVKLKASVRLLESEKVLGRESVDININDFREYSTEMLQEIIKKAKAVPSPVIQEAELIE